MLILDTQQKIEDFTRGCCFYATGGGGPPLFGQQMLIDALNAGKHIRIIDVEEMPQSAWTLCPYLMGSSGPETEDIKNIMQSYGLSEKTIANMPAQAAQLLLTEAGIRLDAIIPLELGGAATASALASAAWLDVPVIDADYEGRALPEISQMLPAIHNVNILPIASCDAYGNQTVIKKAINLHMMERIGKYLSSASFGLIGQACLLRQLKEVRPYMLVNTLSKAYSVGVALRQVSEKSENVIESIINLTQAKVIFTGNIVSKDAEELEGYYVGNTIVSGTQTYKNNQLKVWFKNEFILSWLNENPYIACPDLITMIDASTYEPIINSQLQEGMEVIVFGLPAPKQLQSPAALKVLGPEHFGFNFKAQRLD